MQPVMRVANEETTVMRQITDMSSVPQGQVSGYKLRSPTVQKTSRSPESRRQCIATMLASTEPMAKTSRPPPLTTHGAAVPTRGCHPTSAISHSERGSNNPFTSLSRRSTANRASGCMAEATSHGPTSYTLHDIGHRQGAIERPVRPVSRTSHQYNGKSMKFTPPA